MSHTGGTGPFSLAGKTILVTGASSGIGRSIAVVCAGAGARLVLTGRSTERLGQTLGMLDGEGHTAVAADLDREEEIIRLVGELPALDGVVHSAGINKLALTRFVKADDLEKIVRTNYISPVLLSKHLQRSKKLGDGCSVVFISSLASCEPRIANAVYSGSKGAINSYARVLALELAPKKIRVNTVIPGMIRTELLDKSILSEKQYSKDEERYPLGRYGRPEEVAYMALYLLCDASQWVTGTVMRIDGGISLT